MKKIIIMLSIFMILLCSFGLSDYTPTAHPLYYTFNLDGTIAYNHGGHNLYNFFNSFDIDEITNSYISTLPKKNYIPIIMDITNNFYYDTDDVRNKNLHYITFSGNNINIFGYNINNEYVFLDSFNIGDNYNIVYMVGNFNRLTSEELTSNVGREENIILLAENTLTDKIEIIKYNFDYNIDTGYSINKLKTYINHDKNDMLPKSNIDCDFKFDSTILNYICGYGTTNNKIVTFGSQDSYNNIAEINNVNFVINDSSSYKGDMDITYLNNIGVSINGQYQVIAFMNDRYIYNFDLINSCSGNLGCVIENSSIFISDVSLVTGNFNRLSYITGMDKLDATTTTQNTAKYFCFRGRSNSGGWVNNYLEVYTSILCYQDGSNVFNKALTKITRSYGSNVEGYNHNQKLIPVLDNEYNINLCLYNNVQIGSTSPRLNGRIDCVNLFDSTIKSFNSVETHSEERQLTGGILTSNNMDELYLTYYDGNNHYKYNFYNSSSSALSFLPNKYGYIYLSDMLKQDTTEFTNLIYVTDTTNYIYDIISITPITNNFYIDTNLTYDGLYGFYNPALINTTQNFIAKKCLTDNNACTYYIAGNTPLYKEILCSDCGYGGDETCGLWSSQTPKKDCYFNTTGTYNLTFNLYSNVGGKVLLHTFEVNDFVVTNDSSIGNKNINLVQPQNPNLDIETIEPIVTPIDDIDDIDDGTVDMEEVGGIFNLLQSNIKLIFALVLCLGLVITTAQSGIRNPLILLLAFVVGLVITTMIGMISVGVLIIMLITITILVIASLTIFKSQLNT